MREKGCIQAIKSFNLLIQKLKRIAGNFCKFVLTKFQVKIKSCCGTGSGEVIKPALIG